LLLLNAVMSSCQSSPATEIAGDTAMLPPARGIGAGFPVDPRYLIAYDRPRFVPPDGRVLLIIGQEKNDIARYMSAGASVPAGFASYWGIPSQAGLRVDNVNPGVGVQNAGALLAAYPGTVVQSALWLVGKFQVCERTVAGAFDSNIDGFAVWATEVQVPIYLRIGYEFDNPDNALDPACYRTAYVRIVDRLRSKGVSNVAFVWHSFAANPYRGLAIEAWYPGDDYVDWVAVSVFGHFYRPATSPPPGRPPSRLQAVVDFALAHRKPVMIAESAPAGGIKGDGIETWDTWFVEIFRFIQQTNVKAFSYISSDWDSYPDFVPLHWGDTRVQEYPALLEQFRRETSRPRYLKRSPQLFDELGFVPH
jgi:hypothetical protein